MTVYLIHFDEPLAGHARHYIGYAEDVDGRMWHHKHNSGARILAACNERKIKYKIVRTWEGEDRTFERKLKNQKHAWRHCPVCRETRKP